MSLRGNACFSQDCTPPTPEARGARTCKATSDCMRPAAMQVMVPKLIHPLPPSTPRTPGSPSRASDEIEEDPPTPHPTAGDTWMQVGGCTAL